MPAPITGDALGVSEPQPIGAASAARRLPPFAAFDGSSDLLAWMEASREQHGDIFRGSLYGGSVYVVCRPDYADQVLRRNYQNYRKGLAIKKVQMLLGNGLMASEGALWKRQRRMMQPGFHPKNLNAFLELIEATNADLKRRWLAAAEAGQAVNVTRDVSQMTLEIVLRTIFGKDYEEVAGPFNIVSDDRARDLRFAQRFRALTSVIHDVRRSRSGSGDNEPDFIGMLIRARDRETGEPMSEAQLANEVLTLIVAGHETTAGTLAWTWRLLAQHPHVFDRVRSEAERRREPLTIEGLADCDYTRRVLEEAMRLYPPGWLMTRRAVGDDEIGGYFVPRGTEVYIPIYVIQRHPDLWRDGDSFDPDRFLTSPQRGAHIPFSAGPRNCIGEHLARLEMLVHFVSLARSLRLRDAEPAPLEYELGVNLRNRHDFVMHPERVDG